MARRVADLRVAFEVMAGLAQPVDGAGTTPGSRTREEARRAVC
jgi:hypothetical protein